MSKYRLKILGVVCRYGNVTMIYRIGSYGVLSVNICTLSKKNIFTCIIFIDLKVKLSAKC